jgi:hypothetical protein
VSLLDNFLTLWDSSMDAFPQRRTAFRARRIALGLLGCLGRHTVTGAICATGRQDEDWSADYRLFSQSPWSQTDLFAPVVQGVLDRLAPGLPFVAALDDTRLPKTGTKIPGASRGRDPLSPPFHVNLIWAQRFLQVSGFVRDGETAAPARSIPVRYCHAPAVAKPKRSAPPEAWKAYEVERRRDNLSTRAVSALRELREDLDCRQAADRRLIVTVDGSYTNQTVLKSPLERTTLIGRIRKDAKLFYPPAPATVAAKGRPRRYGAQAPTPEQLRRDDSIPWQEVQAFAAGRTHDFRVKTLGPVLWPKAGADKPLQVMVIAPLSYRPRKGSPLLYRQPAYLICQDLTLPAETFLQYYLWHWGIEVNHRDEKQIVGVGEAQVRSPLSADRQPAFAVGCYSMLLLAGVQTFGLTTAQTVSVLPKWRAGRPGSQPCTQDLLQRLRGEIWGDALDALSRAEATAGTFGHFVSTGPPDTKPEKIAMPLSSAILHCRTG